MPLQGRYLYKRKLGNHCGSLSAQGPGWRSNVSTFLFSCLWDFCPLVSVSKFVTFWLHESCLVTQKVKDRKSEDSQFLSWTDSQIIEFVRRVGFVERKVEKWLDFSVDWAFSTVIGFRRRFLLRGICQGHHCELRSAAGPRWKSNVSAIFNSFFL